MKVNLTMWGKKRTIKFVRNAYANNNRIEISAWSKDEEYGGWEPWASVTVNLMDAKVEENCAHLDTNNCSPEIIEWLYENKYVEELGTMRSGYCMYPYVRFTDEFLNDVIERL